MTLRKLPKGWEWRRLADLISGFDAGVSVNGGDRAAGVNEFGVLKISAITEGIFHPEQNKVIEGLELERASLNPKPTRLVMSRANTPNLVGASAYIDGEHPNLFLSDKGPCQNNLTNNLKEIKLSVHENRRADPSTVSFNPWLAG